MPTKVNQYETNDAEYAPFGIEELAATESSNSATALYCEIYATAAATVTFTDDVTGTAFASAVIPVNGRIKGRFRAITCDSGSIIITRGDKQ